MIAFSMLAFTGFATENQTSTDNLIFTIDDDVGYDVVTIDSALGIEVEDGDCIISFLDLCRQASDVINIDWTETDRNKINQIFMAVAE